MNFYFYQGNDQCSNELFSIVSRLIIELSGGRIINDIHNSYMLLKSGLLPWYKQIKALNRSSVKISSIFGESFSSLNSPNYRLQNISFLCYNVQTAHSKDFRKVERHPFQVTYWLRKVSSIAAKMSSCCARKNPMYRNPAFSICIYLQANPIFQKL